MTTNHRAELISWFARLLAGLTIVAAAGYTASFPVAAASSPPGYGQEPPEGTVATTEAPDAEQGIIPEPNSGHEPIDSGDRGGALQIAVFLAIVGGVAVIGTLIVRESRRNLARRSSSSP